MAFLEKTLSIVVWFLIISSMVWFVYGCYDLFNLFFMEG